MAVAGPRELAGGAFSLAVARSGSHAENMAANVRLWLWQNPTTLQNWLIFGERPSLTAATREQIQDSLKRRVLVTGEIATQLKKKLLGSDDVAGYTPQIPTANSIAESRFPLGAKSRFFGTKCTR